MVPLDLRNTLVFILAGGAGSRLMPLTQDRAKPAVPFGGSYRIIDFTLSNCIHSGLRRIHLLTQYQARSLEEHIRFGWNFLPRRLEQPGRRHQPQTGEEARHPQDAEPVLPEPPCGVADGAEPSGGQVGEAALGVADLAREGVEVEGVAGEVAPPRVHLRVQGVLHLVGSTPVGVAALLAEGGDLDLLPVQYDHHHAEALAHGHGAVEEPLHRVRQCVGHEVEVHEGALEHEVSDRAAHDPPAVAPLGQPRTHAPRELERRRGHPGQQGRAVDVGLRGHGR